MQYALAAIRPTAQKEKHAQNQNLGICHAPRNSSPTKRLESRRARQPPALQHASAQSRKSDPEPV